MSQAELTGHCSCGKVHLGLSQPPLRVSVCHCHECQRRSGSAFATGARFNEQALRLDGVVNSYQRVGDEGSTITFYFCPNCATTLYYRNDALAGMVMVPVGVLAPHQLAPTVSVYDVRRPSWVCLNGIDTVID